MVLELIIAATVIVSLISLVAIALFLVDKKKLDAALFYLVSFSAGALLGAAFFDLLPDAIAGIDAHMALGLVFIGLVSAFVLEKIIHWHHHHHIDHEGEHKHPLGLLTLIGDTFHNFFDGVAISAAFIVSAPLGIATTLAVILHEIPHEIGNFSLLIYSGYSRKTALLFNFFTALASIGGGVLFFYFSGMIGHIEAYALAFTAGTFIYVASADLMPELHKEKRPKSSLVQLLLLLLGAALIWLMAAYLGG